ncbi:DUF6458 family protein [Streptomyces sp. NPDC051211]|uniref:DUF6458 family protein n=1 Tax=Streptomyces sp. NPDC051211 TaxID=3154643 RepID=UPI00344D1B75
MGMGGCIALIAVGAILTFATDWEAESVNLDLVGVILMLVGIIGLAVYASVLKRRHSTHLTDSVPVIHETVHETRHDR